MVKFIYTLIFVIWFSALGFSQGGKEVAMVKNQKHIVSAKTSGEYNFTLPDGLTNADVNHNANYYTHYFTVEYNESSREAKIKLKENTEKNRHVIVRFLISCGVQKVTMDGKSVPVEEFYNTHMK